MTKMSSFISKLLKKVSCFRPAADTSVSEEDAHHHEQQQKPQQQEEKLVIYVGGVGVDQESMMRYDVPSKYVSYPTFRALLEISGEELETILSRGSVVIRCEIAQFEPGLKLVETKEREAACRELGYDERLWSRYWNKKSSWETGTTSAANNIGGSRMRYSCSSC